LRTYVKFKTVYGRENYLSLMFLLNLSKFWAQEKPKKKFVINHKNISSILKFWKLIHVIPTILKRSCLVLSYFEQDIKNAFFSQFHLSCTTDISLTPEVEEHMHQWALDRNKCSDGKLRTYVKFKTVLYMEEKTIFLWGFSWTQNYHILNKTLKMHFFHNFTWAALLTYPWLLRCTLI
jgi:hypothetical protein